MRLAVTYENNQVFQHFGKTPSFMLFEIEDGRILSKTVLDANGSGHGALAGFLKSNNVSTVICGGIGAGAKQALSDAGIPFVCGVSGDVDQAVNAYLGGTLVGNPDFVCGHHDHGHEEGGHHSCHSEGGCQH